MTDSQAAVQELKQALSALKIPIGETIRLVEVVGASTLGSKRNFGCELADGDVIAHWDDDDYSAPGRLAEQVDLLAQSGRAVAGYHTMRFTDGEKSWLYMGAPSNALGTSLCYRRDWWEQHKFPALQVGEDSKFSQEAFYFGQLASIEARDQMYATIHPGNTSPRNLGDNWKPL